LLHPAFVHHERKGDEDRITGTDPILEENPRRLLIPYSHNKPHRSGGIEAFPISDEQPGRHSLPDPELGGQAQLPGQFLEVHHRENPVHDQQGEDKGQYEKENVAARIVGRDPNAHGN
tara:strand:+ start:18881 stop:19234 length:354 start_codon:yes stop_codon:yes gene_type:complete